MVQTDHISSAHAAISSALHSAAGYIITAPDATGSEPAPFAGRRIRADQPTLFLSFPDACPEPVLIKNRSSNNDDTCQHCKSLGTEIRVQRALEVTPRSAVAVLTGTRGAASNVQQVHEVEQGGIVLDGMVVAALTKRPVGHNTHTHTVRTAMPPRIRQRFLWFLQDLSHEPVLVKRAVSLTDQCIQIISAAAKCI
jgi:hypothetical protein